MSHHIITSRCVFDSLKMPRRKANADQFYFSRHEIEDEFEKLFERANFCEQCRKFIHCRRAEFVGFNFDRKMFCTSNKDVKNWKIQLARENKETCNFTSVLALFKLSH